MKRDGIVLKEIIRNGNIISYKFEARGVVKPFFTSDEFWIEYDCNLSDVPDSVLTIPFVSLMLPIIWLTDTVLWVREIDKTFYHSIFNIQDAYQRLYRHVVLQGNVVPANQIVNTISNGQTALLFGGGIDANCTLQRIKDLNPRLINIQGWYHNNNESIKASTADFKYTEEVADKQGLSRSLIKSNFAVLIDSTQFHRVFNKSLHDSLWHGFQHSMSFISISIPLCYHYGIAKIYIASSIQMGEYLMCGSHVTTDSEYNFCTQGECIHDASELTRQDKVHIIVTKTASKGGYPLKVCSFHENNCCECDKCFRSILGIVAEGANIEDYGFKIQGNLKEHWAKLFEEKGQTFNIGRESLLQWPAIKQRMRENYDNIKYKDFVDWFLSYDFGAAKKSALIRYYRKNFFSIIRRKLSSKF